jgi:hypothetical protein
MEIIGSGSKVQRISNQPSLVLIMTDLKQQDNVKYFSYLCSIKQMMQNLEVKLNPVLPQQKQYQLEENYFHQQIGIKFKEETSELIFLDIFIVAPCILKIHLVTHTNKCTNYIIYYLKSV